ncbi:hypothetical protein FYJ34_12215 [Clostridiaceae bacterium 68-1-5]|uniref:Uncharacterized protein n=1 Tax=Suipraeoptans intestinalis TaxID=2606628 RepID=A0A6N7V030_9FIRM|nr:hypothetical protein [Suipraeoptans intestinalis]MSR93945.1 hypothetical protein [Suipraeoptans intestinalis]MSR94920.1 hypothetical protein [Suipraeoptans intestinalis]
MAKSQWKIEFNETGHLEKVGIEIPSFRGKNVTKDILERIRYLDYLISGIKRDQEAYFDSYDHDITEYVGYFKFYFERLENEEVMEKIRVDVGDGLSLNEENYRYIESFLEE